MAMTLAGRKPIFLLADSQLLFARGAEASILDRVLTALGTRDPRAVYVGVSNGDAPQFYELFEASMEAMGIGHRRWVHGSYTGQDVAALEQAELILLAGGDVLHGLEVMESTGMKDAIVRRYLHGAAVIGVSAGAVQLAFGALATRGEPLRPGFRLVPFLVGAHEEREHWKGLRGAVQAAAGTAEGIGIPFGGGMMYHPDDTVEAYRLPLNAFRFEGGTLVESLCLPLDGHEVVTTTQGAHHG